MSCTEKTLSSWCETNFVYENLATVNPAVIAIDCDVKFVSYRIN